MANSEKMKEMKNAFRSIRPIVNEKERQERMERADIGRFKEASFGEGSNVFRADSNGAWLGAETFAAAPFKIDMNGNMYLLAQTGSGYILIDAENSRIIVNDGTNDRGVWGYSALGF